MVNHKHGAALAPLQHEKALQLGPAVGIARLEAGQTREIVQHHQLGVAPGPLQAALALVVAEVGQRLVAEIGDQEVERGRRRAEEAQAIADVDRGHLAVDVEHLVRAAGLPAQKASARGGGPGDAQRHERLAEPARPVEQGERVAGEDGVEQGLALGQRRHHQLGGRHQRRQLDVAILVEQASAEGIQSYAFPWLAK